MTLNNNLLEPKKEYECSNKLMELIDKGSYYVNLSYEIIIYKRIFSIYFNILIYLIIFNRVGDNSTWNLLSSVIINNILTSW
jgi:hypothetical protein